jgi:Amidohydrolase family
MAEISRDPKMLRRRPNNAVTPETPVFLLHLYDRAILNAAALRAVGYTKDTPNPPGGEIVRGPDGTPTGLLLAKPNAGILYATLAKGPKLPFDYQLNSTRHFMRELNRLGVTGAIDAGGGFQNYPEDYAVIEKLAADGELTIRLAYNLFTQEPNGEKDDFLRWTRSSKYQQGDDYFRHNGAGEMLVFSAADFEDFQAAPRHAAGDGARARRGGAHPGPEPLALAAARHLRRDDQPGPRRARARESGHPARRPTLVLRPRRDHLGAVHRSDRGAGRRHRRAAPHSLSGRILR